MLPTALWLGSVETRQNQLLWLLATIAIIMNSGCGRIGYSLADDGGLADDSGLADDASELLPELLGLSVSLPSPLTPAFTSATLEYQVMTSIVASDVMVTPTALDPSAVILVNGERVASSKTSSPIALALGANRIVVDVSVGTASRSYLLEVNRAANLLGQVAYVKASNTETRDRFGYSVSLSGDTLAVGAYFEDSSAYDVNGDQADNTAGDSGAVYVFRRVGSVWSQEAYLKASNTDGVDYFGQSISLSGDTLAVGAYEEDSGTLGANGDQADNSVFSSGAVYVFRRAGSGVWSQEAYLKASNTDASDQFGFSLSLSNDTLVVGARLEDSSALDINGDEADNSAISTGAVYVFRRAGSGIWSQEAYLKASNTENFDYFGVSVSISGDTLAVGAYEEDSAAFGVNGNQADNSVTNSGAVYVFRRVLGIWSQEAYLKASNTGEGDKFGSSVSLAGDTLAVGAFWENSNAVGINGDQADNSATNSGAMYVFRRMSGAWSQEAYLKASNTESSDIFGASVSLSGDTLAVGAVSESSSARGIDGNEADNSAYRSGAVYVFRRMSGAWSQQAYLKASTTDADDVFGQSVSLSGDTLAVGAYGEGSSALNVDGNQADNSAYNSGAVYLFQ